MKALFEAIKFYWDFLLHYRNNKHVHSLNKLVEWSAKESDEMLMEMWDVFGCYYYILKHVPERWIFDEAPWKYAVALFKSLDPEDMYASYARWLVKQRNRRRQPIPLAGFVQRTIDIRQGWFTLSQRVPPRFKHCNLYGSVSVDYTAHDVGIETKFREMIKSTFHRDRYDIIESDHSFVILDLSYQARMSKYFEEYLKKPISKR